MQLGFTPGTRGAQQTWVHPWHTGQGVQHSQGTPWSWGGAQHSQGAPPAWGTARQGLNAPRLLRDVCECFSAAEPSEPVKQDIKGQARRGSPGPPPPCQPLHPKKGPTAARVPPGPGSCGELQPGTPSPGKGPQCSGGGVGE